MKSPVRVLLVVCFLSVMTGTTLAASSDEMETTKDPVENNGTIPFHVYWKNGFYFSSYDRKFHVRIEGAAHFDSKFYISEESANPSQFDIRRVRIGFRGSLYDYLSFRLQAELSEPPRIRHAWVDCEFRPWLHLVAGQMKVPFSTSWLTPGNNVNFLERGANTPLHPYFDRGFLLWGDLFGRSITYNLGVFTGTGMERDNSNGDIDDHKDLVVRIFTAPFFNTDLKPLKKLYLVGEWSGGGQTIPTNRYELRGYGAAVRDDKFWIWETNDVGHGEIKRRDRWGAEFHYIYGPFSLSSEYLVVRYEGIELFASDGSQLLDECGEISSWSTWMSYFLTGESKTVSNFGWKQPNPKRNFNPSKLTGPGAWELLIRYTRTETDKNLFETTTYAGDEHRILMGSYLINEYSAGLSWTWNPLIRWQLNYVYLEGDDKYGGIRTGHEENEDGYEYVDTEQMVGLRMIFRF